MELSSSPQDQCRKKRRSAGFILVEAVISTLVVGLLVVASLRTMASVTRTRRELARQTMAHQLARELLTEVQQARYKDEPSSWWGREDDEGSVTRNDFDDTDDYHNWSASPPETKDGAPLFNFIGWTRKVIVTRRNPKSLDTAIFNRGLVRIEVQVTDPDGNVYELYGLRAENGAGLQAPVSTQDVVTWTGVKLQVGTDTEQEVEGGTNLLNQVPAN